jgi:predicted glycoside hydrolase/deacetylase ChbG (UPF0249 family)
MKRNYRTNSIHMVRPGRLGNVARLCHAVVACTLVVAAARPLAAVETWAERLGYPSGKRVLILYAPQLGMCHETNQAGTQCLEQGWVQSASVMPTCPWFNEFAEWNRHHGGHDVGLSFVFNSEWSRYRWRPAASRSEVSSLVDADGYLWKSVLQFSINARAEEVKREMQAQIRKAMDAGFRPTHLVPHLGALLARPELTAAYLETAQKMWIPAVIIEITPKHIEEFRARGTPLEADLTQLIANYQLPKLDELQFVPMADSYEQKREQFFQMVRDLPPGLTQVIAQPALDSDALRSLTDQWQQRVWDAQLLADPAVHEFLIGEEVLFTNWIEIMRRFEGTMPAIIPEDEPSDLPTDEPEPVEGN